MAIEIRYGWEGKMLGDIVKLNYTGMSGRTFLTVAAKNPGIGTVIERLISHLHNIPALKIEGGTAPERIIEILAAKLGMTYDSEKVEEVLQQYHYARHPRITKDEG